MQFTVGCRSLIVQDPVQQAFISLLLLYPASAQEQLEKFGAYAMTVATDAATAGRDLLLVVISHGGGGSGLTYRDLACFLVRAGFVVALPEHPGNNRADNSLEGTAANLENRPRHISLVIDACLDDARVGHLLRRDRVGVIGHSMGGYTALAVAGGRPIASPHESVDGQMLAVAVTRDRRVRALVLLAPACAWYWAEGALTEIDVPILLYIAGKDERAQQLFTERVESGVSDRSKVETRLIENAGHHAFQSPFPQSMARPDFAPSQDPPGFDRALFLTALCGDVVVFLQRHL